MSRSRVIDDLMREDMELAQQLETMKPPTKARGGGRKPVYMSDEEKWEARKLRARISYKKRQLAKIEGPNGTPQRVQSGPPVESSGPPTSRAPAKRSLPAPPQVRSGPQMIFVPAGGAQEDLGYNEGPEEGDSDDEDGVGGQ